MKKLKTSAIILIVLGIVIFAISLQLKILHWPDPFCGTISGPLSFAVGLALLIWFLIKKAKKKQ